MRSWPQNLMEAFQKAVPLADGNRSSRYPRQVVAVAEWCVMKNVSSQRLNRRACIEGRPLFCSSRRPQTAMRLTELSYTCPGSKYRMQIRARKIHSYLSMHLVIEDMATGYSVTVSLGSEPHRLGTRQIRWGWTGPILRSRVGQLGFGLRSSCPLSLV